VAVAWEAGRDPLKALPFYEKACAGGIAPACERAKKLKQ
jgi:TPR repeat protein